MSDLCWKCKEWLNENPCAVPPGSLWGGGFLHCHHEPKEKPEEKPFIDVQDIIEYGFHNVYISTTGPSKRTRVVGCPAEKEEEYCLNEKVRLAVAEMREELKKEKPKCWCEIHRLSLENARDEMESKLSFALSSGDGALTIFPYGFVKLNFCPECGRKL